MINIKALIEQRDRILQQAQKIGIKDLYACLPLANDKQELQCFLINTDNKEIEDETLVNFKRYLKETTEYQGDIKFFNKQAIEKAATEQQSLLLENFNKVLKSAKALKALDSRPLEEQLNEPKTTTLQEKTDNLKINIQKPISSLITNSPLMSKKREKEQEATTSFNRGGKKQKAEAIAKQLEDILMKEADPEVRRLSLRLFMQNTSEDMDEDTRSELKDVVPHYLREYTK